MVGRGKHGSHSHMDDDICLRVFDHIGSYPARESQE